MYADHFYYLSEYGGELIPLERFAKAEKKSRSLYKASDLYARRYFCL